MNGPYQVRFVDLAGEDLRRAWDRAVVESPQGTCFARAGWLEAQRRWLGLNTRAVGIFEGDRLIGGMALAEVGRWGIRGARRPWATPFNHPFLSASVSGTEAQAAFSALRGHLLSRYHFATVTCSYRDPAAEFYRADAGESREKCTILLDISNPPELWTRLQSELRNRIRKARKGGVVVREGGDLKEFHELYVGLFEGQGRRVPFTAEQFTGFCRAVEADGLGKVYEARDPGGRLHVAALITWDSDTAYYTLSASHPELRRSGANALLLWEIFEALSPEIPRFDLVGANLPAITRFKNRFRGETVAYPEFHYYAGTWTRRGVRLLHRFAGT